MCSQRSAVTFADLLEDARPAEPLQVVTVDPLHLEQANSSVLDKVVDVDQIVLLDAGHAAGHARDPGHFGFVTANVVVGRGRKDLERDATLKVVGAEPLA